MVELAVRIVLATTLLLVSGASGKPPFEPSLRAVALFATYSFLAFLLERRGLRNPGVSGLVGVADAAVVVFVLASSGLLASYGFLALLPTAYAVARFSADALAMSPLVAAWLLIGANLFGGSGWTPIVLVQACGVLGVGMLGARREKVVKVTEYVEVPSEGPKSEPIPHEFFDLREKYRTLRHRAAEIERSSKRDSITAKLVAASETGTPGLPALANRLRDVFGVEGLTLFALDDSMDLLVVRAASGDVPASVTDTSIPVPEFVSEWQLRDRLTAAVHTLKSPESVLQTATVVLKERGRIVGLLALFDSAKGKLADASDAARDASETIARFLRTVTGREKEARRVRQAELLYLLASTVHGADSPSTLSQRVSRELWESLTLDHLGIRFFDHRHSASAFGGAFPLVESMSFGESVGIAGWIGAGSPDIVFEDARNDEQSPREVALKHRIGSFVFLRIESDGETVGCLSAATHRSQGIDAEDLASLRIVAAELGQAYDRIVNGHTDRTGLATPAEFHEAVKSVQQGHLVYLDVLRRDEAVESFGRAAVEKAVRQLGHRLRSLLPPGALLCRRPEGDFVAFVRSTDEDTVRRWAANAGAAASLVSLVSLDGKTRSPMAVRAKVAPFAQQSHRISQKVGPQ